MTPSPALRTPTAGPPRERSSRLAGPRARAANASTPGRARRDSARGITLVSVLSLLSLFSGCASRFDNCEARRDCPSGGVGGSAGNTASGGDAGSSSLGGSATTGGGAGDAGAPGGAEAGGAGAGGAAGGEAGAAGNGGVGGAPPCDGACGGATPSCEPVSNQCVECLARTDCSSAAKPACDAATNTCVECATRTDCGDATPACDTATNTCVECLEQADCADPSASQCDLTDHTCKPCSLDADCSDIDGKGVCLAGTCVECTATKATACGSEKGTPLVCDSLEHTCTTQPARSADLCQPCVSDAQCMLGELCVLDTIGSGASAKSVGYFCHWKQGDTANGAPADCPTEGRPYVRLVTDAVSVDGETADVCVLAVSSCPANNEFRDKNCAPAGTANDSLCGVSPPNDAKCVPFGAGFRCTMTCGSNDDCRTGFPCNTARLVCEL